MRRIDGLPNGNLANGDKTFSVMTTAQRRNLISADYLQGMNQHKLGEKYGINQSTVSRDLEWVRQQWVESAVLDFHEAKVRELARIDKLEEEGWAAWFRSQEEHTRLTSSISEKNGNSSSLTKETPIGNVAYLGVVQWCVEQRCRILGLYEATKISLDWRKAVEEQGYDPGAIFAELVGTFANKPDTPST